MRWLLTLAAIFVSGIAQAQDWKSYCFQRDGGAGPRVCQIEAQFRVRDARGDLRGSVLFYRDPMSFSVIVQTDKPLEDALILVDQAAPVRCHGAYDCRIVGKAATDLLALAKSGTALILHATFRRTPISVSWSLQRFRSEAERIGW